MTSEKVPQEEHTEIVERELTAEEKRQLSDAWVRVVLGRGKVPAGVENFTNEQLKEWLYDSLIDEILLLRTEWGLAPDIEKYRAALEGCENDAQRANIQFQFIHFFNDAVAKFDESHPKGLDRPRRWESRPKTMRESKNFNCVGATLLALATLEKGGITSFFGDPAGHAVAVARLADGEYIYVDVNSDKVFAIRPEEKDLGGVRCLVVKDPRIKYEIVPIFDNHEIVQAVLGNLSGVSADIKRDVHESDAQKKRTEGIYASEKEFFDNVDFLAFKRLLYGPEKDPWNRGADPAFRVELIKAELIGDFDKAKKELPSAIVKELIGFLAKSPEDAKQFMLDISHPIPGVSDALRAAMTKMHENAWRLSGGNQEAIIRAVDHLIFQMRSQEE